MKLFKRGLAMALALMVLVMAVPFGGLAAYAAEAEWMVEGADAQNDLYVPAGGTALLDYIPEDSGYYTYYSSSEYDVVGSVRETGTGTELASDDDSGENMNFSMRVYLQAGVCYTFEARYWNGGYEGVVPVYLVYEPAPDLSHLPALEVGIPTDAIVTEPYAEAYLRFTPAESGYYVFSTNMEADTYANLYDVWGEYLASDDDGGENTNFRLVYYLTGGADYKLAVHYLGDQIGAMTVLVEEYDARVFSSIEYHDVEIYEFNRADDGTFYDGYMVNATVTLSDGSTVEVNNRNFRDDVDSYYIDMDYDDMTQWKVGGSYPVTATVWVGNTSVTGTYNVHIVDTPVASVTVPKQSYVVNYNGYTARDDLYDENGYCGTTPEYHKYSIYPENIVITMKDGTVINSTDFEYNGYWYNVTYTDPQSYDNQWGVGIYTVQGSIMGYDFTYEVEVEPSPVASIEFQPITLIENYNGYWNEGEYWDDDKQEYVPYNYFFYYSIYPRATITMRDGTVYEDANSFSWNGQWYGIHFNQDYDNYLTLGTNYMSGSVLGYDYTAEIVVETTPIQSIVFEPARVVENSGGYWSTGSYWDEELEQTVEYEYYVYNELNLSATVTMKDGTVYNGTGFEYKDSWYSCGVSQSYENRLTLGMNHMTGSVLGYEYAVDIEVVETPVASVTVAPIVRIQNYNGYWNNDYYWTEEGDRVDATYFHYYNVYPNYGNTTITLKDGTVIKGTEFEWEGRYYYLNTDGQWAENYLQLGVNEWHGSIAGYDFTYTIEIIESPVASVTVNPISLIENRDGYWRTTGYWNEQDEYVEDEWFFYYTNNVTPRLTVTMKDGTVHSNCTNFSWNGDWYYISIDDQNGENHLLPGKNVWHGSIAGYEFEYDITVSTLGSNESYEYMEGEDYVIITDCYLTDSTVTIPDTINGKKVTGVVTMTGAAATLNHLILPDSVVTIGDYLLSGMDCLESVHFGAGVSNLVPEYFQYCWDLAEITVSEDNPYYCVANGGLHDKDLSTLIAYPVRGESQEYLVPATVVNIDVLDQYNIYREIYPVFPEDHIAYTTIDGVTYNKELTKVISCRKDKTGEYVMPETVEEIADGAFMGTDLTSVVVSPKVTEIVYCAFASCASLESVTLPDGLVSIEQSAFEQTESLTEINLPDTLEHIGYYSFYKTGLTDLQVPGSVSVIAARAFYLSKVTNLTLGEGLGEIGDYAFAETPVTSAILPDSLTYLGNSAFSQCEALSTLRIGSNLEIIGDGAFSGTSSLYTVVIPGNVGYIGSYAFGGSAVANLTLNEGLCEIGSKAFNTCNNLTAVHLPATLGYLDSTAFNSCNSLTELTVAEGNEYYFSNGNCVITHGGTLVAGCGGSVIPDDGSVTRIEDYAFYDVDSLREIHFPDGLLYIGRNAFSDCDGIGYIEIPDSVTTMMYRSFEDCDQLTSIEIPITVQTIEENAFDNCYNLTDVYYQGTEADRDQILYIESWGNEYLLNATWHYEHVNENWDPIPACDHVYESVCDSDCDLCGRYRTAPHMYENACDDYCEACGEYRAVTAHVYDNACDTDCNECGAYRKPANHVYDNACDTDCNECGATREVEGHVYDNACDADCNECGATRTVGDHVYDNKYDADCNECGVTREVPGPVVFTAGSVNARPGDTVTVDVRIDNNSGVAGFRFDVEYDESKLELIDAVAGSAFAAASFGPVRSPFNVLWIDAIHPNNTANDVIVTLTFLVKADAALGASEIRVVPYDDDVIDNNLETVLFETVSGAVNVVDSTPGDADGDGVLNMQDLGLLMQYINGWDVEVDASALDVNDDGKVNNRDYALIQRYLNGWDVQLY